MDILARHMPPANDPNLIDARREWLRTHPAWMIHDGCVFYLFGAIGRECAQLEEYPGPLWLRAQAGQADCASLERIAALRGLEGLSLHAGGVGDRALGQLARTARGLRCLWLREVSGVTGAGLGRLAELPMLDGLEIEFGVSDIPSTDFLAEFTGTNAPLSLVVRNLLLTSSDLTHLAGWTRLEACDISIISSSHGGFSWLSRLTNLRHLALSFLGQITHSAMERIAELRELTTLELSTDSDISPTGLAFLPGLKALRALAVNADELPPACAAALARCAGLRELSISGLPATTSNIMNIAAMPGLENLHWHSGEDCLTNESPKPDFAAMAAAPRLRRLTFDELTRPWIEHPTTDHDLAGLAGIKRLAGWELRGDEYTPRGLACLASLPELTELSLECLGGWSEAELSCLADFPALATLSLDFDGRDKPRARRFPFLAGIEKLTALTISLRKGWAETMLDDISAVPKLKRLCLRGVPPLPAEWLVKLARLPELEEISLEDCPEWRDGNIPPLAAARTLRRISISGCDGITAKGLLHLRGIPLEAIDIGLTREMDMDISLPEELTEWTAWPPQRLMALRLAWPEAEIR